MWCCSGPDPEGNPSSMGLAEDRGLWKSLARQLQPHKNPLKSKPGSSFFSCNPLIFHSPWGNYCWGLRLEPEGWRKRNENVKIRLSEEKEKEENKTVLHVSMVHCHLKDQMSSFPPLHVRRRQEPNPAYSPL